MPVLPASGSPPFSGANADKLQQSVIYKFK